MIDLSRTPADFDVRIIVPKVKVLRKRTTIAIQPVKAGCIYRRRRCVVVFRGA